MSDSKSITIILPAYNEEGNLLPMINALTNVLESSEIKKHFTNYILLFIDDGSKDRTLEILKEQSLVNSHCKYVSLSRNFGQQLAIKTGLDYSTSQVTIVMDCDLQHPPELIITMVQKWAEGYEIVYPIRTNDRKKFSPIRSIFSKLYHKIIASFLDIDLEQGVVDFSLLDKKALDVFKEMNEFPFFMRGLRVWMGFKQISVPYIADKRFTGQSKYTIKSLFKLAMVSVLSFSTKPLEKVIKLGFYGLLICIAYFLSIAYMFFVGSWLPPGWATLIAVVIFLSSLQITTIGILSLYIANIFMAIKKRPLYIVSTTNLDQ